MILQVLNMIRREETKNILIGAYHSPSNNLKEKWDNLISYIKKLNNNINARK